MATSVNVRRQSIIALAMIWIVATVWLAVHWLPGQLGSFVEERLGQETGLRWRIGDLALNLNRGLILRDVTVQGENGLEGHFGSILVVPSVSVLLGDGGPVRASIEVASMTLPLEGSASPAVPHPRRDAAAHLSEIRATLQAPGISLGDRGRTYTFTASMIAATLHLAKTSVAVDPGITLDLPEAGLSIVFAPGAPDGARTLQVTLMPEDGPRVFASAHVLRSGLQFRIDEIAGTIDKVPFAGDLRADASDGKPRIEATLKLDALSLNGRETRLRGDRANGIAVPLRVMRLPDLNWIAGFEGQAVVSIKRLIVGAVEASEVVLAARMRDGQLDTALEQAALYGGTVRGRYVMAAADRKLRHEIGLNVAGVRTRPLLDAIGASGLDGAGAGRIDVGAQGFTWPEMLASATGRVEIAVTDGRIDGLDLARAAGLTQLGGGLATRLDRLGANFTIGGGRANTDDLRLKTNLIDAKGIGDFDLIGGTMDLQLKPITVLAGGRIDVPIRIAGPWSNPSIEPDLSGLAQDPGALMEGLTNLGAGLLGRGGDIPRREGVPDQRDRGGQTSSGQPKRLNGVESIFESFIKRRDNSKSRP
ncbi:AsmA-like C-terminal region-containing protein [Methylobacterium sp. WL7]|uniref:AsmA family protein n=1 Tax=Methylobacterium sp. WL7 TaxID=2603900 RepID=UPI0011C9D107|nr:AsmA-like C-terminal region-containing protein [Methylobacterium sp. WL7]TXN43211.1 AsmA family protein [Methylobacterium sp. WL7]